MSRGGRGGRGGFRGGLSSSLNHGNVPFEIDLELQAQADTHRDHGLFPPLSVPRPQPLNKRTRHQVEDYRELQLKFRHGPYYRSGAHIGLRGGISKERRTKSVYNAFEDNASYLKRRAQKARDFLEAEFDQLPWCKEMLPKELWETIGAAKGPQYRPRVGRVDNKMSMKLRLDKLEKNGDNDEPDNTKDEHESNRGDDDERRKDEDGESVEYDDTFEDNEDDMAGDYNAEQYFDGGDEDGDDDLGGGGGGGDDW